MELGLTTFVEYTGDPLTGRKVSPHQRMRDLMEEIVLAEQVGLDVFAIGEHHRPDFLASAPTVILGAAAERTKKMKLSTAVTVLSSEDPVRVYQQFATVDLLSGGRAEIMAGRGSFIESFPLFGYDLRDYDTLFDEKLRMLVKLNDSERITWSGKHRAPIKDLGIYPRPHQEKLPIWVAIGGTPESVHRAATLGLPMMLAIIGGTPDRFAPYTDYYRKTATEAGHDPSSLGVGINQHCFIGEDSKKAADDFYPSYSLLMSRIGKERGWPPMTRDQYEQMRARHGALLVGSVQEVIDKILYEHELFKMTRFLVQMTVGSMPHDKVMKAIELFGDKVAPEVRKAVARVTA